MMTLTPIVRRILILWVALWILDFLLSLGSASLMEVLAMDPAGLLRGDFRSILGIVGYATVHETRSFVHLFFNCWLFAMFAPEIELLFPGKRFVKLLLKIALIGTAFTLLMAFLSPHFGAAVVGGSGFVAAMIAANAALYPDRMLNLILLRVKLLHFFVVLTALDFLGFLAQCTGTGDRISYTVHLAGAATGWLAVGGFQRVQGPWSNWATKRAHKQAQKKQQKEANDEERLDAILAKISRDGMQSLTDAERAFLRDRSRK
ncbi:MAG: rhomboid family intramembrane serine protease [Planctomycetota bacterium]